MPPTVDLPSRTVAEADVENSRGDLGPFVIAAESTRMPMLFTDARPGRPVLYVNPALLALTGHSREELLGQGFGMVLHDPEETERVFEAALSDEGPAPVVHCVRRTGEGFRASLVVSGVPDAHSKVTRHFISLVDMTPHEVERAHMRFVLEELAHRTRNTLAVVQSIAERTLRDLDPVPVVAFMGRLRTLYRAHEFLRSAETHSADLHEMLVKVLEPFGLDAIRLSGPAVGLSPSTAVMLAMAFYELATNAAKYGALSGNGLVGVSWDASLREGRPWLRLCWNEIGGPEVVPPTRRGFGTELIEEQVAHALDGTTRLTYSPEGLEWELDVPMPTHK